MIKIEITENQAKLIVRAGTTRDGKPYTIQEQRGYIYLGGDYPQEFSFMIPDGHGAFPAGLYRLGLDSIRVGQFSKLEFNREFQLLPVDPKNSESKK